MNEREIWLSGHRIDYLVEKVIDIAENIIQKKENMNIPPEYIYYFIAEIVRCSPDKVKKFVQRLAKQTMDHQALVEKNGSEYLSPDVVKYVLIKYVKYEYDKEDIKKQIRGLKP